MSWVAVGVAGAGIAASVIGSQQQAKTAKGASKAATIDAARQELARYVSEFGPEEGMARFRALNPQAAAILGTPAKAGSATPEQQAQLKSLDDQIAALKSKGGRNMYGQPTGQGGNANQAAIAKLQAQRDALAKSTGAQSATAGMLDPNLIGKLGPGLSQKYGALADTAKKQAAENLSRYDAETSGLTHQAQDIETQAKHFGEQRLANLREDTDREQTSLDRKATAALTSRGIAAGSAMTDALAANSDQARRQYNAGKAGIEDSQIQMRTGLATGTLGVASSRLSGRNSLITGGQQNEQGLRVGALNTEQAATSGSTPYYPTESNPSAAAMMTAGAGLTGYSSPLAGYAFRNWMNSGSGGGNTPNTGLDNYSSQQANSNAEAALGL